jgi:hypothetical protein
MSEDKPLKTVFTTDAKTIKNKANVDTSMLLTWVTIEDNKENYHQAILPLSDMHIRHDDDKSYFKLDIKRTVLPLPVKIPHLFVCVCDDPEQEWTGDWGHLGAFRVRAIFHRCVLTDDCEDIEIVCSRVDCETDTFEVQNGFRTVSDDYVAVLRSPEYKGVVLPGMFK